MCDLEFLGENFSPKSLAMFVTNVTQLKIFFSGAAPSGFLSPHIARTRILYEGAMDLTMNH